MAVVPRLQRIRPYAWGLDDGPVQYDEWGNPIIIPGSDMVGAPSLEPLPPPIDGGMQLPSRITASMASAPQLEDFEYEMAGAPTLAAQPAPQAGADTGPIPPDPPPPPPVGRLGGHEVTDDDEVGLNAMRQRLNLPP